MELIWESKKIEHVKSWTLYLEYNNCSINVSMFTIMTKNISVVSKGETKRKGVRRKSRKVGGSQILEGPICIF